MRAVEVRHVYKVFGDRRGKALAALKDGATREDVAQRYGATAAVADVSLDVEQGEIFVIMGLSGSGKSTLVRCLNLLHRPTDGTVKVFGQDLTSLSTRELRSLRADRISMVFQSFGLLPHLTVLDNVRWGLKVKGIEGEQADQAAREAIELVGLGGWEGKYPDELSGGMQQRVGIARALAVKTDVILMDEAFSALDPLIRSEMQDLMLKIQQELGKTIVFITHDLNEAMYLGDHIAIMRDGRLVQTGTPEQILQDPADDYVSSFVESVDRSRILTVKNAMIAPDNRITITEGPLAALHRMRVTAVDYLYVIDRRRRLVGYVLTRDVIAAARAGESTLAGRIRRDYDAVRKDATINEALSPSVESPVPLAVISGQGRLLGIVPKAAILAALDSNAHGDVDAMGRTGTFAADEIADALKGTDAKGAQRGRRTVSASDGPHVPTSSGNARKTRSDEGGRR